MNCTATVRLESFDSISEWWTRVVESSPNASVFDTLTWQKIWWEQFGQGCRLNLVTILGGSGRTELLAPLFEKDGVVSFLGGTDLVDFHALLSPSRPAQEQIDVLAHHIVREKPCRLVELTSLPQDSPILELFPAAMQKEGWRVDIRPEDVAPRTELAPTFEEFVAGLDKKDRHELRRKMRRIEAAGKVGEVHLTESREVSESLDDFLDLHRKSMPEKAEFMTPKREAFFRRVSVALAEEGITRLRFLELDGRRVAGSLSFVVGKTWYLYNSGYEPDYRELAVGLMNHAYSIRRAINDGVRVFDFMRGNEPYKYDLGGVDREVLRLVAYP